MEVMKKILYALKTTKKYESRRKCQSETWLSGIEDYIYYSDHEDLENNVIFTSHDDTYQGLMEKSLYFYNNLGNIFLNESGKSILDSYEWIFIGDDDTFVNTKKIENLLLTCDDNCAYGYLMSQEKDSRNMVWRDFSHVWRLGENYFSGGGGILVSTKSLKKVNEFVDYGINTAFEDCTISLNLSRNGINLIDCEFFHSTVPEYFGQTDEDIVNNITYHHISEDRMYTLYEYLK
jgi:hypothetical protein